MELNLTLLGEMITFIIFIWVTMKFVWPPIVKAMRERQKKIADGLAAAEEGKNKLEFAKQRSQKMLENTKQEASKIIDQSNSRANQIIEEAKSKGHEEGLRIINAAQADIGKQFSSAKEKLTKEISDIAILGAEKILKKNIDKATHDKMIDELIGKL